MANHDSVPTYPPYRPLSREEYGDTLHKTFVRWLNGRAKKIEVQGLLGATAARWGDNAQTRAITAAITEWDAFAAAEARMGEGAPAGEHFPERR